MSTKKIMNKLKDIEAFDKIIKSNSDKWGTENTVKEGDFSVIVEITESPFSVTTEIKGGPQRDVGLAIEPMSAIVNECYISTNFHEELRELITRRLVIGDTTLSRRYVTSIKSDIIDSQKEKLIKRFMRELLEVEEDYLKHTLESKKEMAHS